MVEKKSHSNKVFISYAWGGESERIANEVREKLTAKGLEVVQDKSGGLDYKGLIKEFMREIGKGDFVVVIISDKYLKSKNCMFELLEINRNAGFHQRIFPIVLQNALIYEAEDIIDYIDYWDEKIEKLETKIKNSKRLANRRRVHQDLDLYESIRNTIDSLLYILSNMNTLTPEIHLQNNFQEIYDQIEDKLKTQNKFEEKVLENKEEESEMEDASLTKIALSFGLENKDVLIPKSPFYTLELAIDKLKKENKKWLDENFGDDNDNMKKKIQKLHSNRYFVKPLISEIKLSTDDIWKIGLCKQESLSNHVGFNPEISGNILLLSNKSDLFILLRLEQFTKKSVTDYLQFFSFYSGKLSSRESKRFHIDLKGKGSYYEEAYELDAEHDLIHVIQNSPVNSEIYGNLIVSNKDSKGDFTSDRSFNIEDDNISFFIRNIGTFGENILDWNAKGTFYSVRKQSPNERNGNKTFGVELRGGFFRKEILGQLH